MARIGIDLSDCLFHAGCSAVRTDALQAVFIGPFRDAVRNRSCQELKLRTHFRTWCFVNGKIQHKVNKKNTFLFFFLERIIMK